LIDSFEWVPWDSTPAAVFLERKGHMKKFYKRFRSSGEPFYVDEAGEYVQESVALNNLVRSGHEQEFSETSWFGKAKRSTSALQAPKQSPRERMNEAFARFLPANH
jgi:hypothetical protein